MTRVAKRLATFAALGAATLAAGGEAAIAETMRVSGVVVYAEKGPLPAGILKIRLEEQGVADKKAKRIVEVEVESRGQDDRVPFEMQVPRAELEKAVRPGFTVRLERADGWLLAINPHAQFHSGDEKVSLTVNPVIY